jgi:hypothetical protein
VQTWQPLLRHFANARDVGFRVIMSHRAAGSAMAEIAPSSVPGQIATQSGNRIMLGAKTTTDKIGGVKFEDGLAVGRGFMLAVTGENAGYVQLAAPNDEM